MTGENGEDVVVVVVLVVVVEEEEAECERVCESLRDESKRRKADDDGSV